MRKTFHVMTMAAVMAVGMAVALPVSATRAEPIANLASVPGARPAASVQGEQLALRTECSSDGTCYVYDNNGKLVVVIG